jgi:radical SAM-linked protein
MESPIEQRIQITFGKFGALRYTGNLDVAKIWERVLRRARLPILYTQGFNTRPRIQLATALPLGITSECEILDVALREKLATFDRLPQQLMAVAPAGLRVFAIEEVPPNSPALQALVRRATYRIRFVDGIRRNRLQRAIDDILRKERIVKVRIRRNGRKSSADIRPLIYDLHIDAHNDFIAHLGAGERGNLQPADLLTEMGLGDEYTTIHRFELFMDEYIRR